MISFLWSQELIYSGSVCAWQGFMWNFGDLSSAFWALAIAIYSVMYGIYNKETKWFEPVAHICCWGGALLFTLVGFSQPNAGNNFIPYYDNTGQNVWCWVNPYYETQRIFLHYFWIFVVMFLLIVLYSFMAYKLKQIIDKSNNLEKGSAQQSKHLKKVFRKLAGYPFVFFVVFAPITADRIAQFGGALPPFNYLMFAICIFASNGFWNSVLYFITRKLGHKYWMLFKHGFTTIDSEKGSTTKDKSGVELNLSISRTSSVTVLEKQTIEEPKTEEPKAEELKVESERDSVRDSAQSASDLRSSV